MRDLRLGFISETTAQESGCLKMKIKAPIRMVLITAGVIWCLIVAAIGLKLYVLRRGVHNEYTATRELLTGKIDSGKILAASRFMMAHVAEYHNDDPHSAEDLILLNGTSEQFKAVTPMVIQDLHPRYMIVLSNRLQVALTQHARIGLYAFGVGEEQSGTVQLTNGLWLYDGTDKEK
jgi:hypothetical protein